MRDQSGRRRSTRCPGARKELHRTDGAGRRRADDPAHPGLLQVDRGEPVPSDAGRGFGFAVVGEQLVRAASGSTMSPRRQRVARRGRSSGCAADVLARTAASANDPFDVRPNVVADSGKHGVVEIGMRGEVAIQQLLALSDAAVTRAAACSTRRQLVRRVCDRAVSCAVDATSSCREVAGGSSALPATAESWRRDRRPPTVASNSRRGPTSSAISVAQPIARRRVRSQVRSPQIAPRPRGRASARGRPSTRSPRMLRITLEVPPMIV